MRWTTDPPPNEVQPIRSQVRASWTRVGKLGVGGVRGGELGFILVGCSETTQRMDNGSTDALL